MKGVLVRATCIWPEEHGPCGVRLTAPALEDLSYGVIDGKLGAICSEHWPKYVKLDRARTAPGPCRDCAAKDEEIARLNAKVEHLEEEVYGGRHTR